MNKKIRMVIVFIGIIISLLVLNDFMVIKDRRIWKFCLGLSLSVCFCIPVFGYLKDFKYLKKIGLVSIAIIIVFSTYILPWKPAWYTQQVLYKHVVYKNLTIELQSQYSYEWKYNTRMVSVFRLGKSLQIIFAKDTSGLGKEWIRSPAYSINKVR